MHGQFTGKQGLNRKTVRYGDNSYENDLYQCNMNFLTLAVMSIKLQTTGQHRGYF